MPDEATALKIGERALIKTYGKGQMDDERPLTAKLGEGIGTVSGTLWDTRRNENRAHQCFSGTAVVPSSTLVTSDFVS